MIPTCFNVLNSREKERDKLSSLCLYDLRFLKKVSHQFIIYFNLFGLVRLKKVFMTEIFLYFKVKHLKSTSFIMVLTGDIILIEYSGEHF